MFRLSTCRIEAKLLKSLDEAILNVERPEKQPAGSQIQARTDLVAAQTAWTEHRAVLSNLQQVTNLGGCI